MGFRVGVERLVRFWLDDWVDVRLLLSLFPRLFRVVSNKQSSIQEWCMGKGCFVLGCL